MSARALGRTAVVAVALALTGLLVWHWRVSSAHYWHSPHVGELIEDVVKRLGPGRQVGTAEAGGGVPMLEWTWSPPWWCGPPCFVQYVVVNDGKTVQKVIIGSR